MKVAIIMGSKSDLEVMQQAAQVLSDFQIEHQIQIVSAHRTPELMVQFAKEAYEKNIRVIIAGAGGAASWPGRLRKAARWAFGFPMKNARPGWQAPRPQQSV